MINYTLKQLYSFEAVVRLGGFTSASKELHITQPAVYMQVQQLQDNIGAKIFRVLLVRLIDAPNRYDFDTNLISHDYLRTIRTLSLTPTHSTCGQERARNHQQPLISTLDFRV